MPGGRFGQKLLNRKDLNRNIKRAGCVSTVGRPVMIAANKRYYFKKEVWCPLKNGRGSKLTASKDCDSLSSDSALPTLSNVSIFSTNTPNTIAKTTDNIIVEFTASEPIQTPVVTFSCNGVVIPASRVNTTNTSGNTWMATYIPVTGDQDGIVTYSIAFSDSAGNAGVAVISGTGSVTFDKTSDTAIMTYTLSDSAITYMQGITVTMTATFPSSLSVTPHLALSGADTIPAEAMTAASGSTTVYTRTYTIGNFDGTQTVALSVGKDLAGNDIVTAPTNHTFTLVGLESNVTAVNAVLTDSFIAVAGQSVALGADPSGGDIAYLAPPSTTTQYGAPAAGDTITAAATAGTQYILAPTYTGIYKAYLVDADSNLSVENSNTHTVETVQDVNEVGTATSMIVSSGGGSPTGEVTLVKAVPQGHALYLAAAGLLLGWHLTVNGEDVTAAAAGETTIYVPSTDGPYKFYLTTTAGMIVTRNNVTEGDSVITST